MSAPKATRGPAGGAAGTSLRAVEASVRSAYFRGSNQRKAIPLATVPRHLIADAIELLIDALDYAELHGQPENGQ